MFRVSLRGGTRRFCKHVQVRHASSGITLALFQPDIARNVGAIIRLTACFGVPLSIIRPTSFTLDDRSMKRASLDYGPLAHMSVHENWDRFQSERPPGRLVLFTTRGATPLDEFRFQDGDTLLFGSETAGVPDTVHDAADARVVIPIREEARSLNLAISAGIALWEAIRK